jgi:hypothetical protein
MKLREWNLEKRISASRLETHPEMFHIRRPVNDVVLVPQTYHPTLGEVCKWFSVVRVIDAKRTAEVDLQVECRQG